MQLLTYLTLDNELVDLAALTDAEQAFLMRCRDAAQEMPWLDFIDLVHGPDNPVLEPRSRVTASSRDHPLYRTLRDLQDRVGIARGDLLPGPDDPAEPRDLDPWEEDDNAGISTAAAAAEKGVTVKSVLKAIARGDLIATPGWGARVSRRSLDRWTIQEHRQRAGRLARS